MKVGFYRHEIKQGEDYEVLITVRQPNGTPQDLSGLTFTSEVRDRSGDLATSFTCALQSPASDGVLKLSLTSTQTALLSKRVYAHDLKQTGGGKTSYLIEGDVIVQQRITA